MEVNSIGGVRFITSPVLEAVGATHMFGTRDVGKTHGGSHARIKQMFPGIKEIATAKQVHHKNHIIVRNAQDAVKMRRVYADIIISAAPGVAAAVRTADCVPVLIACPKKKIAAAVHAGWKGTALKGPARAVEIMRREFGCEPENLAAAIGPSALPCHYQVDAPVIEMMEQGFGDKAKEFLLPDSPGKMRLDMTAANREALVEAGLNSDRIDLARLCTVCEKELFYSYRREGKGVPSLYHFVAFL